MCLIISGIFAYIAFIFYSDGDITNMFINGSISILFIGLMINNIIRTRKEKS
jgi:hypothetical protein